MTLLDGFGRVHTDLRVSLTDRCSLRCTYCMPADGLPWISGPDLLSTSELMRLVGLLVDEGVTKVRLTGGEPLLRPDVVEIVAGLVTLGVDVSLTTNGLRLPQLAQPLADAGLQRVNVSLDTLRRDRFEAITRRDRFTDVLTGLAAARIAGLHPVKVNAVLMRGVNDDEATEMLTWALAEGYHLRFIEQMPLDPQHGWDRTEMVTADEILAELSASYQLTAAEQRGNAPAEEWLVDGGPFTVGIVGSVTRPFCEGCDRLRLTADGQLRNCLFARDEQDLRGPLRAGLDATALTKLIHANVAGKRKGHGIGEPGFVQPDRPMSAIGG